MTLAPDSFAGALVARLATLTPEQRRVVLANALRHLATVLPRLAPAQRRVMAAQVAEALDLAGYPYEALLLRLTFQASAGPADHTARPWPPIARRVVDDTLRQTRQLYALIDRTGRRYRPQQTWWSWFPRHVEAPEEAA